MKTKLSYKCEGTPPSYYKNKRNRWQGKPLTNGLVTCIFLIFTMIFPEIVNGQNCPGSCPITGYVETIIDICDPDCAKSPTTCDTEPNALPKCQLLTFNFSGIANSCGADITGCTDPGVTFTVFQGCGMMSTSNISYYDVETCTGGMTGLDGVIDLEVNMTGMTSYIVCSTSNNLSFGTIGITGCCELDVTCPEETNLGNFNCTTIDDIPDCPVDAATAAAAPYNITIGDAPCGDIVVSCQDDITTPDVCVVGGQVITRTITVFDDLNGDQILDSATEESEVCTYTIGIIEDTAPPEATCSAEDEEHECDGGNEAAADAWNAGNITALENCSSDDCGGISVTSDYNFSNLSDDCGNTGSITVTYTIADDCGNSITDEATFTIVDTTAPEATCSAEDEEHECDGGNEAAADVWNAGNITALENCSSDDCGAVTVTSDYNFSNLSDDCGNTGSITVTYTIVDDCGNSILDEATFTIVDTTAPEATCSAEDEEHECDGGNEAAADVWNAGNITALENCSSDDCGAVTVTSDYNFSNLSDDCGNTGSITVTYTIADDCGNSILDEATFTIVDNTAPEATCSAEDEEHECDGDNEAAADAWNAGNITALENCSSDDCGAVTVTSDYNFSNLSDDCGNTGSITVTYTIADDCGNSILDEATFTIVDNTAPEATCSAEDEEHECDGDNEAAADAWNAGNITALENCSSDDCGAVTVTSDYNFSNLSDDCGNTGSITVTYTIADDCGNSILDEATFTIVDNTAPEATCSAEDEEHECDGDNEAAADAWNAGNITALENCSSDDCGAVTVTSDYNFSNLSDDCGNTGSITVTYTIADDCGNSTTDEATFTIVDTTAPEVTCPGGETLTCFENVPAPLNTMAAFVAAGGTITDVCSNTFTVFSNQADNGGTNCPGDPLVVTRTYFVQDACGNTTTCDQVFTYEVSTADPVITSVLPACFKSCGDMANPLETDITYETDCSFGATVAITGPEVIGEPNCSGTIYRYTYTVTDDCGRSTDTSRDFIVDNGGPIITCAPFNLILDCGNPNNQNYIDTHLGLVNVNTSCDLGHTISYTPQNIGLVSCGAATVVTFTATDACGRTATCTTTIAVQDNTAPVFTEVPPSVCDVTNCSADINYWYNHWIDYMEAGLAAVDDCDTNVSIQAENIPVNTDCPNGTAETVVDFVATDNCGNTAVITGTFIVEATPMNLSLLGQVMTEAGEMVESVVVSLDGNNVNDTYETVGDGMYGFNDLTIDENYSVTPELDENPLNGVSSFDLLLIAKHILQIETLDSPYKMIAADVNSSGSITTMDLLELRKLILHIDESFAANTSWKFVAADFIFPVPTNPFISSFPEDVFINGLVAGEQHDFIGVKIGDVNESVVANLASGADDRNLVGDLVFDVTDQKLRKGETYDIAFRADNFEAIHGYQFTLGFDQDALTFAGLNAGELAKLSEHNFGLSLLDQGVVTTSWTSENSQSMPKGAELFHLNFTAKKDVNLSEVLRVNSRYTKAEAYNGNLDLLDVTLRFEENEVRPRLELLQNNPNPFIENTVIGFMLPEEDADALLTIYDVSGKILFVYDGPFGKGYNEISISSDLLKEGLYFYQLRTRNGTLSKSMIVQKR